MKSLLIAAGLTLAASTAAFAQASPAAFTEMAASGGMFEIESSREILKSGTDNADVKAFAEQMIKDHEKAGAELKVAAAKSNVPVPTALLSKDATRLKNLQDAKGDKTQMYVTLQRLGHNDAVVLHRAYAASGTDANLKTYAETVTPTLEEHAKHIDMLAEKTMAAK